MRPPPQFPWVSPTLFLHRQLHHTAGCPCLLAEAALALPPIITARGFLAGHRYHTSHSFLFKLLTY